MVGLIVLSIATRARIASAQLPAPPASSPDRIHLGGYAAMVVSQAPDSGLSRARISEGTLAALVSGSLSHRVSYFAELDAVSSSRENYAGRQDDRTLEIARLYAEFSFNDALRLRAGRFLTSVGQWNEIHAEPLTWTSVRPLATYRSFAKYTTGAVLAGQGSLAGRDLGYAAWMSPGGTTRGDSSEVEFGTSAGGRVAAELLHNVWLGASAAWLREHRPFVAEEHVSEGGQHLLDSERGGASTQEESDDDNARTVRALTGLDVRIEARGAELLAEATWLGAGRASAAERAAFAQLVVPLVGGLHAVGRTELFSPLEGRDARMHLVGLTWRGPHRITVKLEQQLTDRRTPRVARGWFFSFSSLF